VIRIDLSLPSRRERLSLLQFTMLFVGIFLAAGVVAGVALLLQWNSLANLAGEVDNLRDVRDSLEGVMTEITNYKALQSRRQELEFALDEARSDAERQADILVLLRSGLEPGMRLLSCRIEADSVVALVLSPSNVKVARYVEGISRSGFFKTLTSEPQGTRQGLIEHRVLMRMR